MIAEKKINNNVVICRDTQGRKLIALGKGLGFGEIPREVDLSQVEQTFYDVDPQSYSLVCELPPEILAFADRIVNIAKNELPYDLNPNQTLVLADHIAFTLERAKKNIRVKMPLAYDVEQMYPTEYKIGKYTVQRMQKEFKVGLSCDEIVGIAMNLFNGRISPEEEVSGDKKYNEQEMLEEITAMVEEQFCFIVSRESFNYSRYATHLHYLFQRIRTSQTIKTENNKLYDNMRLEFPEIAECVDRVTKHIEEKWQCDITTEEKFYLMLHINRICVKEGL